jgi:hypothetical protein
LKFGSGSFSAHSYYIQLTIYGTAESTDTRLANVIQAFEAPYKDPNYLLQHLLDCFDEYVGHWNSQGTSKWYSPYTTLVQASGWGKSRAIRQLAAKDVYIFYCSFQKGSGYPYRSSIADDLDEVKLEQAVMTYVAYFTACLEELADSSKTPEEWAKEHIKTDQTQSEEKDFWERIRSRLEHTKTSLGREKDKEISFPNALENAFEKLNESSGMQQYLRDRRNTRMNVLFVFDEARSLLDIKYPAKTSRFLELRRALWYLPQSCGAFAVILDTTSRLSNFQPASLDDPSQRVKSENHDLFDPLYLLSTTDVMSMQTVKDATLHDIINPKLLYRYGRPMWGAQLDAVSEDKLTTQLGNLVKVAMEKLVGGGGKLAKLDKQSLDEKLAVAILGPRIGLDVAPQCHLASELVASHMRACAFISLDRRSLITMFPVEPILAEASAQIIHVYNISLVSLLEKLISAIRNGWIEGGYRGELVARLVLMLAMETCIKKTVSEKPKHNQFSHPVLVNNFIEALFGVRLDDWFNSKYNDEDEELKKFKPQCVGKLVRGMIFFTSFISITYTPTSNDMLEFLTRGVAIICKRNQKGIDFIIPILLPKDDNYYPLEVGQITYLLVQVKNWKVSGNFSEAATVCLSTHYAGIDDAARNPYISLYMQLGSISRDNNDGLQLAQEPTNILTRKQREVQTQICNGKPFKGKLDDPMIWVMRRCLQIPLVALGLSQQVYACLQSTPDDGNESQKLLGLLQKLLLAWPDPAELHISPKKRMHMKRMYPVIYAETTMDDSSEQGDCSSSKRQGKRRMHGN